MLWNVITRLKIQSFPIAFAALATVSYSRRTAGRSVDPYGCCLLDLAEGPLSLVPLLSSSPHTGIIFSNRVKMGVCASCLSRRRHDSFDEASFQ
ncbi:hypothetical protein BJ170DRAFT_291233 [Xylariales sp. AK1849]|nr:hypothetical protein BJ170DRAFT_291233 [Xylariales sp. AK1849]